MHTTACKNLLMCYWVITYSSKAGSANVLACPDLIRWKVHGYFLVEVWDKLVWMEQRGEGGGGEGRGGERLNLIHCVMGCFPKSSARSMWQHEVGPTLT